MTIKEELAAGLPGYSIEELDDCYVITTIRESDQYLVGMQIKKEIGLATKIPETIAFIRQELVKKSKIA